MPKKPPPHNNPSGSSTESAASAAPPCPCQSVSVRVSPCVRVLPSPCVRVSSCAPASAPLSLPKIKSLRSKDGFLDIDLQFADFILKIAQVEDSLLYLAAAIASNALHNSHICVDLNRIAGTPFPEHKDYNDSSLSQIILPELSKWKKTLESYPAIVSKDGTTPLILDGSNRLYLQRYWFYETELANLIKNKCHTDLNRINSYEENSTTSISKFFKSENTDSMDWQQVAVFAAIVNDFTLITGGPGTGKTTIISTILAMMLNKSPELHVKLCAPTGKAAARLKESIDDELANLNIDNPLAIQKMKELETYTIHRLLGPIYLSPHFKHNETNKLSADVIIIDEASMISLPLFAKLFRAIKPETKIILLGDKDQLNSVEAGAVLANLCDAAKPNHFSEDFISSLTKRINFKIQKSEITNPKLTNCVIELTKSYRFDDNKGIGLLKNAINNLDQSNPTHVLNVAKKTSEELLLKDSPASNELETALEDYLENLTFNINGKQKTFNDYIHAETKEDTLNILSEFKILCSHRRGPYGIENINKIIHNIFAKNNKKPKAIPIMITENNSQLELYNGDIGIIWHDNKNHPNPKAYFQTGKNNPLSEFSTSILPAYEEVFAMTIHKSQGSGFQKILMILPDKYSPLLTRELVYTGITRAKKQCEIWANDNIFAKAIQHKTERDSGLKEVLSFRF